MRKVKCISERKDFNNIVKGQYYVLDEEDVFESYYAVYNLYGEFAGRLHESHFEYTDQVKAYYIKDNYGKPCYRYGIYLDKNTASMVAQHLNLNENTTQKYTEIEEDQFPFLKRNAYYINAYFGFDYGMSSMYDITRISSLYHCHDAVFTDPLYKSLKERAISDPDNHIITLDQIASSDLFGDAWFYGDAMENKFNLKILKARVYKVPYTELTDSLMRNIIYSGRFWK